MKTKMHNKGIIKVYTLVTLTGQLPPGYYRSQLLVKNFSTRCYDERMTPSDLQTAIKDDLYNELRWLLCAATQWQACHVGAGGTTPHLKVYAMDSTFLHARALYEFFTATRTNNPDRLIWKDFGLSQGLSSTKYSNLISDLHGRALHLNKNRSSYQAIKDEVAAIATDVLDLWDTFATRSQVQSFKSDFDDARRLAIQDANRVAQHCRITPVFQ